VIGILGLAPPEPKVAGSSPAGNVIPVFVLTYDMLANATLDSERSTLSVKFRRAAARRRPPSLKKYRNFEPGEDFKGW